MIVLVLLAIAVIAAVTLVPVLSGTSHDLTVDTAHVRHHRHRFGG